MNNKPVYLTEEGLQNLKDELQHARTVERQEVIQAIAEARGQGDLSENAEYDAAKDAQGMLEARIAKLEDIIGSARVVDETTVDNTTVRILSKVRVMNHKLNKEALYTIVSAEEANFSEGKISVDSPIGKGLLGKSVGDSTEIKAPAGRIKLEILEISR
ncbi:MAG: transcription elongation factor GreA [Rubricoccaceae bacterium]|nr:transcription elongation factor GreA [Rubricoccaceae bacterium]